MSRSRWSASLRVCSFISAMARTFPVSTDFAAMDVVWAE